MQCGPEFRRFALSARNNDMTIAEPVQLTTLLVLLGMGLKRSALPDYMIPRVLLIVGPIIMLVWCFANGHGGDFIECLIVGIGASAAPTGLHQLYRQETIGRKDWDTQQFLKAIGKSQPETLISDVGQREYLDAKQREDLKGGK